MKKENITSTEEVFVGYNEDRKCYEIKTNLPYLPINVVDKLLEQICEQMRLRTLNSMSDNKLLDDNKIMYSKMVNYRKLWLITLGGFIAMLIIARMKG